MRSEENPRTMSIAEGARVIGCSRALITAAVERGELPAFRLGDRVFLVRAAIERLFADDTTQPEKPKGVQVS